MDLSLARQYKLLYQNAVLMGTFPRHRIPTKEDWIKNKKIHILKYKYYFKHAGLFDDNIRQILTKNHFAKYLKFLYKHF